MAGFLAPVRAAEPTPDRETQHEAFLYVRSFLLMRVAVGVLGVSLPVVLVLGDKLAFDGDPFPRGSLSAYYYSGMRDVYVGVLSAIGVFLFAYKISERNLDNTASVAAGICAALVALFPTARPQGSALPLTPLQDLLGEQTVKWIHFSAGGLFVGLLALLSYYFGVRSPPSWRRLHWTCTAVIVLAVVWMIVTLSVGAPHRALLYGEWVCAWAFGVSWLASGRRARRGRPSPAGRTS